MKKYPLLIGLIGLVGISITRVSLISSATLLSVDAIKTKVYANPLSYTLVYSRINQLFSDYDQLLKQYKAATSPVQRSEIQKQMDDIKKELNKLVP